MSTFSKLAFFPLSSEMTIKVVQCYQVWFLHISQKSFSPRIFVNSFVNSLSIHLSIHLSIRLSICLGPSIKAVFSLFKTWLLLHRRFCKNLWPSQNIWTLIQFLPIFYQNTLEISTFSFFSHAEAQNCQLPQWSEIENSIRKLYW